MKKIHLLILVLGIVLVSCVPAISQNKVYELNGFKRFVNSNSIKIDTIGTILGTLSDSVGINKKTFSVFLFYPKNVEAKESIMFRFKNGDITVLYKTTHDTLTNYTEYEPVGNIKSIMNEQIASIDFRDGRQVNVSNPSYFIDFFKSL